MIKQMRSWSKDSTIPKLIGKKKVDWSIFEYGTHIPIEFHKDFDEANHGNSIPVGQNRKLTLVLGEYAFEAVLVHIDQRAYSRTALQLRYDSNKELKAFM